METRKLKADLLAELLYYRRVFNEDERNQAHLSIKTHYNGNHFPYQTSSDFDKVNDFCINYLIPYSERCSLIHIVTRRVDK